MSNRETVTNLADLSAAFDSLSAEAKSEIESDLTDLPTADQIIEQAESDFNQPTGLAPHEAEAASAAMAVIEQFGNFTEAGFQPFLVRPISVDARAYATTYAKAFPVALRVVQRGMMEAQADPDNIIGRVSLNLDHKPDFVKVDDTPCPEIVAIYSPESSEAFKRGSVAVAFLYQPTLRQLDDGRVVSSYYNRTGISGMVAEWTDYGVAEDAMAELRSAVETVRRLSAAAAKREDGFDTETSDAQPRRPRPATF